MKKFLVALLLLPVAAFASITSQADKTGPAILGFLPATQPIGWPFQQASDLLVLDEGQTGAVRDPATVLTLGSDYTVAGGGYNGAVQMQAGSVTVVGTGANAVLVNDVIVIMRAVPINQTTSFSAAGPLTIQLIEQALDKITTIGQQVNEIGSRSLQFENFEFLSGVLNKTARSNQLLGFNGSGQISFYPAPGTGGGSIVRVGGTTNQIAAATSSGAVTLSLPSAIVAPGSIASTTSLTVGTTFQLSAYTTAGILQNDTSGNVTPGLWKFVSSGNILQTSGGAQIQDVSGTGVLALVANGTNSGLIFQTQSGGTVVTKVGSTTVSTLGLGAQVIEVANNFGSYIGQDGTHAMVLEWNYNATPANANAEITTFGLSNNLTISAQSVILSSAGTASQLVVGFNGDTTIGGGSDQGVTLGVTGNTILTGTLEAAGHVGIGVGSTSTSPLHITGLPTSASGLATGDVWNNSGVLTIH